MKLALDHRSAVPLYHQLVEALRYRIATGELKPETVLPPLRRAATLWDVNLHTVRRAYGELARIGVVRTSTPGGTRILPNGGEPGAGSTPDARRQFVQAVVQEARLRHGLGVAELVSLLRGAGAGLGTPVHRAAACVVECSQSQCEDLAGQIARRWRVRATPWVLGREEPPRGAIIATYFHYNAVRVRWPERVKDLRFLVIAPEANLRDRLRQRHPNHGRRLTVVLCEKDDDMARNIATDLIRILPAREFRVVTRVFHTPQEALEPANARTPTLFSPRMWGELPPEARQDPRAHQVRYVFDSAQLEALGVDQGWDPQ